MFEKHQYLKIVKSKLYIIKVKKNKSYSFNNNQRIVNLNEIYSYQKSVYNIGLL